MENVIRFLEAIQMCSGFFKNSQQREIGTFLATETRKNESNKREFTKIAKPESIGRLKTNIVTVQRKKTREIERKTKRKQ